MKEILETIGAFANGEGGTIVIGVTPAGRVLGVNIGKDTLESLANGIQQQTDPKVFPSIDLAVVEGRTVILLRVETSQSKPVLVQGRGYKRVGRNNHVLSSSELVRVLSTRWETSWDAGPMFNATLDDIEAEALRRFLRRARQERNMALDTETPLPEALEKLELLYEGRPSRAAVLLFGKRPQKFLLPSEVRCARFKGTEPLHFIDMKVIEGNIIDQVAATMEFIQRHISMAAEIVPTQIERLERWEYPHPQYAEISGAFVVTFRKAKATKKYHEGPEQIERQKQAIEYVRQQGRITTQDYTKFLGVSTRTARRDLAVLVEKGVLRRVGKGRAGYFELA